MNYKNSLIEKYHFTHDERILSILMAKYGIQILLEFDTHGMDILARHCINNNEEFQRVVGSLSDDDLTMLLQHIYQVYINEDTDTKFEIIDFISNLSFYKNNRKRNNIYIVFVVSLIRYERNKRIAEEKDELDMILTSFIIDNSTVDMVSIYTLSETVPEIYLYILNNLDEFFNLQSLNDIIFAIVDIFNRLYDLLSSDHKNIGNIHDLYFSTILEDKTDNDVPIPLEDSISKFLHKTLKESFFTIDNDFFNENITKILLNYKYTTDRAIIQYNTYFIFVVGLIFDVIKSLKETLLTEYIDYIEMYDDVPFSDISESIELRDLRGMVYSMYFREIINNYPIISHKESYTNLSEEIDEFLLIMKSNGIETV